MDTARVSIAMVLGIVFPLAIEWRDKRRLAPPERERVWGVATWAVALYAFSWFSLLGWSWVTRRGFWRYVWGPLWLGVAVAAAHTLDTVFVLAAGLELQDVLEGYQTAALAVPAGVAILGVVALITYGSRALKRGVSRLTTRGWAAPLVLVVAFAASEAQALERFPFDRDHPLPPGRDGWAHAAVGGVRGITVGPIESALHPEAGYGTERGRAAFAEAERMGATWVAITPFGRVWDLDGGGVDLTFEADAEQNARDVLTAIRHAHELGLRVMLVPHLWVESGGWRAQIDPGDDAGWERWAASYRRFLLHWADIAERGGVELFSVGVELRSWVTGPRASSFRAIIADVRAHYRGLLTYSANWDDVEHTVILGELDVIGVNAFYPLTKKEEASYDDLRLGGLTVAADLQVLATTWHKPVLLTEMGYTTRPDPALRPWEWPDGMQNVVVDEVAQATAYRALLTPLFDQPWCAGFFVWRTYADPDDVSQEAEWGFSPRGKRAELVLRDAFSATWASDPNDLWASWSGVTIGLEGRRTGRQRARTEGLHAWELSPPLEALLLPAPSP